MPSHRAVRVFAQVALLAACAAPTLATSEAAEPLLAITEVRIEPTRPAADTLCRLRVKIANRGDEIASQLGFAVRINGREIPVYGNQLFMYPLAPGETSEIALFNFWTTETSRPMPAGGKMTVEVELREARWMRIEMVENVETWTPLDAVPSLPVAATLSVDLGP